MGDPVRRTYVRTYVDRQTQRRRVDTVELTEEEAAARGAAEDAEYRLATPEGIEAAGLSRQQIIAERAGDAMGTGTRLAYSALDGALGGAVSADLRGRVGEETAEQVIGAVGADAGPALLGRAVGNIIGVPGLGAVGVGRGVAGAVGGGRLLAGAVEGVFGGTIASAEQAALTGEDFSEHLIANVGLGLLAGVGGEALLGTRNVPQSQATITAAREAATSEALRPGFVRRALHSLEELASGVTTSRSIRTNRPFREVLEEAVPVEEIGETGFIRGFAEDFESLMRAGRSPDLELDGFVRTRAMQEGMQQVPAGQVFRALDGRASAIAGTIDEVAALADNIPRSVPRAVAALRQAIPEDNLAALAHVSRVRGQLLDAMEDASGTGLAGALEEGVKGLDQLVLDGIPTEAGQRLVYRGQAADALRRAEQRVARLVDPDAAVPRISKSKIRAKLNEAARSGDTGTIDAISEFLQAAQAADDLVTGAGGASAGRDFLSQASSLRTRQAQYASYLEVQAMLARETQKSGLAAAFGGAGAAGIGGALGFAAGGPLGAAAGIVASTALTRPIRTAEALFRARKMLGRNQTRATQAIRQTETNLASTKRIPHAPLPVPKAGVALALVNGSRGERRAKYDEIADQLEAFAANPVDMANTLADNLSAADGIAEGTAMHTAMKMQAGVNVLLGALPPSRRRGLFQLALSSTDIPASQAEVDDFLQIAAVVEDPFFGVDLMNAGRLSPQGADALRQMYPRIHGELVASIATTIRGRRERGQHVNYQAAVQYSMFAGAPLDDTLEPGFIAAMQDQSAQTQQQEQAQFGRPVSTRRPTGFTDNALSSTQQLEQR